MEPIDEVKDLLVGLSLEDLYSIESWLRLRIHDVERREQLTKKLVNAKR